MGWLWKLRFGGFWHVGPRCGRSLGMVSNLGGGKSWNGVSLGVEKDI